MPSVGKAALPVWALGISLLATTGRPVAAWATDSPPECPQAYEKAQEERAAGHLTSARAQLQTCIAADCPAFIRQDCAQWIRELDAKMPSVVFTARRDGREIASVRVTCDGVPVADVLDGKPVSLDPGVHTFRFQADGSTESVTTKRAVAEGERYRLIAVDLPIAVPPAPVVTQPAPREIPPVPPIAEVPRTKASGGQSALPYIAGAVAAVGIGGFVTFGTLGRVEERDLARSCGPACSSDDVSSVRAKYAIADISLGVGVVAAAASTYLFVTRSNDAVAAAPRPNRARPTRASVAIAPSVLAGALGMGVKGSF